MTSKAHRSLSGLLKRYDMKVTLPAEKDWEIRATEIAQSVVSDSRLHILRDWERQIIAERFVGFAMMMYRNLQKDDFKTTPTVGA
jgi:hypothetical protein